MRQIEFLNHISIDYNEVDCFPAFDDWLPNEILSVIFSVRTKHKASVISIMPSFQINQQAEALPLVFVELNDTGPSSTIYKSVNAFCT